ncbi:nucleoporin protein Ndc1-Nup [Dipodascopsis tothii]|uniref:nucleoporin protein Ndc1-Nup n=1 Tax=Dipodascopsis tothii TaxID=44089 RepID=UPI0034D0123C
MVSIARSFPASPSAARTDATHYHVVFSGVMQMRFGQLLKFTLIAMWALGIVLGWRHGILWAMFLPLAGAALSASIFPLYVARKANLHVDAREQPSLALTLYRRVGSPHFVRLTLIYGFSAAIITAVYCHYCDLGLFLPRRDFELSKLNENRIYLNSLAAFVTLLMAGLHCARDYDRVQRPIHASGPDERARALAGPLVRSSARITGATATVFVVVYTALRNPIWRTTSYWVRLVVTLHRGNLYAPMSVSVRTFLHAYVLAFMLITIWQAANAMFSIYMTAGPRYRGQTISSRSPDRNGTLLAGLRARSRPFTRLTAFEELADIAFSDPPRRDEIYKDIDRQTQSMWASIYRECSAVLADVRTQIAPPPATPAAPAPAAPAPAASVPAADPATHPLRMRQENIFLAPVSGKFSTPQKLERRLLEGMQDPEARQSAATIDTLHGLQEKCHQTAASYWQYIAHWLEHPYAAPLRCTIQRRARMLLPNPALPAHAIGAMCQFVVLSMYEDTLGTVQRDIPRVLDDLDSTILALDKLRSAPDLHWSDVENIRTVEAGLPVPLDDVEMLLNRLHQGFEAITLRFEKYLKDMGLSANVWRRCKQVLRDNR